MPPEKRRRSPRPRSAVTRLLAAASAVVLLAAGCTSAREREAQLNGPGEACPVTADPSVTSHVRIGWQTIPNGDLLVHDQGLLESCLPNAVIEWIQFDGGNDVVQAFGSGAIDIGISGSSATVKAMSPPLDLPVQVIWIADIIGGSEALVARDPAITTVEDLRGKKVAVTFGATPHYSLLSTLEAHGLSGQVEVVNLTNDVTPAAWDRGEIDAVWTWEPTLSVLTHDGGHVVMTSEQSAAEGHPTFDLIWARTAFVDDNAAFLRVWTALQDHASRQLAEDPAGAAPALASLLGTDAAAVREQMAGYSYPDAVQQAGPDGFGGGLAEDLHSTSGFLADVGLADAANSPEHYRRAVHGDAVDDVAQETNG